MQLVISLEIFFFILDIYIEILQLFHFEYFKNALTETTPDSLKTDTAKRLKSQELKQVPASCKKH